MASLVFGSVLHCTIIPIKYMVSITTVKRSFLPDAADVGLLTSSCLPHRRMWSLSVAFIDAKTGQAVRHKLDGAHLRAWHNTYSKDGARS